jgi:hypothetical protein
MPFCPYFGEYRRSGSPGGVFDFSFKPPIHPAMNTSVEGCHQTKLRQSAIHEGKRIHPPQSIHDIRNLLINGFIHCLNNTEDSKTLTSIK